MANETYYDKIPISVVANIGRALTSNIEMEAILRTLLQSVSEFLAPDAWGLLLKKDGQYAYRILYNEPSIDRTIPIHPESKLVHLITQKRKSVLWYRQDNPEMALSKEEAQLFPTDALSMIACPLYLSRSDLGIIIAWQKGKAESMAFSQEQVELLKIVSDFAAVAIQNAHNFRRIQELTIRDDLTGLANFRQMQSVIKQEFIRSQRYHKSFSLVFIDLDHFKKVNDEHGHLIGSAVLVEVAELILQQIRKVDIAARYGGDEFVVLLPETQKDAGFLIAERIRSAIEAHVFQTEKGLALKLTASLGVAAFPEDASQSEEILSLADKAMYEAKASSRNKVVAVYES